jgi:hypothetical protein
MVSALADGDNVAAKTKPKPNLAAKRDFAPRICLLIATGAIRIDNCFRLTAAPVLFTFQHGKDELRLLQRSAIAL